MSSWTSMPYPSWEEMHEWTHKVPYVTWPRNWLVKAVPPFGGAIIRYFVTKPGREKFVSVYLDGYNRLGVMSRPYWEVYPYNNDTFRCYTEETDKLLNAIRISLRQIK